VPSDDPADIARPCVRRRRFRALATHRGSAERPRGDSPRPNAESDRDTLNRCVAFQDAARNRASIAGVPRDANDRRWPAGPAPVLPATGATTIAIAAKADGQMGKSADSTERGRSPGGAGQDSRAGGPHVSTTLIGRPRSSGRRLASPVEWRSATPTSMVLAPAAILARHRGLYLAFVQIRAGSGVTPHIGILAARMGSAVLSRRSPHRIHVVAVSQRCALDCGCGWREPAPAY